MAHCDSWEDDDWHTPINFETKQPTPSYASRVQVEGTIFGHPPQIVRHVEVSVTPIVTHKLNSSDFRELVEHAKDVFGNSRNIRTDVQINVPFDIRKLYIQNNSHRGGYDLNSLYEIKDLTVFLKAAVDHYGKVTKSTTVQSNKQQLKLLRTALDKVNNTIYVNENRLRQNMGDASVEEIISNAKQQQAALLLEIAQCNQFDCAQKKSDATKLVQTAISILRILSKNDSRANALHRTLKEVIYPIRYREELAENEERARQAEIRKEEENELRRERKRVDNFISRFTKTDEKNFMEARDILFSGRVLPYRLQKYQQAIEMNRFLTFQTETPTLGKKPAVKSAEAQFKSDFPLLQKSTKQEQTILKGAWTVSLDSEKLSKLPDFPIEKKQAPPAVVDFENYEDYDPTWGTLSDNEFGDEEEEDW